MSFTNWEEGRKGEGVEGRGKEAVKKGEEITCSNSKGVG